MDFTFLSKKMDGDAALEITTLGMNFAKGVILQTVIYSFRNQSQSSDLLYLDGAEIIDGVLEEKGKKKKK